MTSRILTAPAALLVGTLALAPSLGQAQTSAPQTRTAPPGPTATQAAPAQFLAKKNLIGLGVYDLNDQQIGEIEDLLVERNGQISAAVVARGGVLGVGAKHVLVPISQVAIDATGKRVHINMTRDQLAQAPRFDYDRAASATGSGSTIAPPGAGTGTGTGSGTTRTAPVR